MGGAERAFVDRSRDEGKIVAMVRAGKRSYGSSYDGKVETLDCP